MAAGASAPVYIQRGLPDLRADGPFAAAILPLNTLWHLPDVDSMIAGLERIRSVLRPGGFLICDLSNPLTLADRGAHGDVRERFRRSFGADMLICQSAAWDDAAEQVLELQLTYDLVSPAGTVTRTVTSLELRYLYRSELDLTLRISGFSIREVFGSYDLDAYSASSPQLLVVAANE
jgi:SAM-dependent methyltransferase